MTNITKNEIEGGALKMVYPADNNANADWSMNDELKSILPEYGHEPGLSVTNEWSYEAHQREQRKWNSLFRVKNQHGNSIFQSC